MRDPSGDSVPDRTDSVRYELARASRLYASAMHEAATGQLRLQEERRRLLVQAREERERAEEARRRLDELINAPGMLAWEADPENLRLTLVNGRVEEVLDRRRGRLPGTPAPELLHEEDRERALEAYRRVAAGGGEHRDEYRAAASGSREVWLYTTVRAVSGPEGTVRSLSGVMVDITARKVAERRLAAQHALARTLAASSSLEEAGERALEIVGRELGAIWLLDRGEEVLRLGPVWSARPEEAERFRESFRDLALRRGEGLPGRAWQAGAPVRVANILTGRDFLHARWDAAGELRGVCAFPIRHGGEVLGVAEFFSRRATPLDPDLLRQTEAVGDQIGQFLVRTRAEEALRRNTRRLRLALETAGLGSWQLDLQSSEMYASDICKAVYGLPPEDHLSWEGFVEAVHPPDRARLQKAVRCAIEEGGECEVEYRVLPRGGRERWILCRAQVVGGTLVGVTLDITCRKEAERERELLLARERQARAEAEDARKRLAFLARISEELSGSLDYETVVGKVAGLAVPTLADWCVVDLVCEDGRARRLVCTGEDGRLSRWGEEKGHAPPARRAMESGRPWALPEVGEEDLRSLARNEEHLALLRSLGIESFAVVPLRTAGRTLGAISVASTDPALRYGAADLELLEELAHRAAQAIENARLYSERQRLWERERRARAEAELGRMRMGFLAGTSKALGSSLDYEETLADAADLAVSRFADWCAVDLLDGDGHVRRLAASHADPAREWLLWEAPGSLPDAVRSGESHLARGADGEPGGLDPLSWMCVPLVVRGEILGAISFGTENGSGRRYGAEDLAVAEDLARRAAQAVERAWLYRERSRTAQVLQRSLLPGRLPRIPGVEIESLFRPAGEADEIGGDFYDVFPAPDDGWSLVVGDVCGKGAEAAALTALARYTLREAAVREPCPARVLDALNRAMLRQIPDGRFCTASYGLLRQTKGGLRLAVSNAGCPPPLLLRAGGEVEQLGALGTLLGVFDDPSLEDAAVSLAPGDAAIFYTDGVIEARSSSGEMFGEERLAEVVRSCGGLGTEEITRRISAGLGSFLDAPPSDDITVLVVRAVR